MEKNETEKLTVPRNESYENCGTFAEEMQKLNKNIEVEMYKVDEVQNIDKEHRLKYKGVTICDLAPRVNSLFGYTIYKKDGKVTKRVFNDEQKDQFTKDLVSLMGDIDKDIADKRSKQADKEQKAKK